jgi:hypothetical protein
MLKPATISKTRNLKKKIPCLWRNPHNKRGDTDTCKCDAANPKNANEVRYKLDTYAIWSAPNANN